jgi:hypothetical protein
MATFKRLHSGQRIVVRILGDDAGSLFRMPLLL